MSTTTETISPSPAYTAEFFQGHRGHAEDSARQIVPAVLEWLGSKSVLDVGCGTGGWLSVFGERGVTDFLGVDGDYVRPDLLQIPAALFKPADLSKPLSLGRTFDLVVSLEVAEHLRPDVAGTFVDSLVRHSDAILFSAAIPGQGGTDHVNERTPQYWAGLFRDRGFTAVDAIRTRFWSDPNVKWWYAQNSVLYIKGTEMWQYPALQSFVVPDANEVPCLVHPDLFNNVNRLRVYAEDLRNLTSRQLLATLRGAVGRSISYRLHRSPEKSAK
jgi:cyclopropane fatty-acyl-phospholipid synthase-like methyltransferase